LDLDDFEDEEGDLEATEVALVYDFNGGSEMGNDAAYYGFIQGARF
jgi:hypothetical protein